MPIVLHLPKADPPPRSSLLEAAATATIALCLDERVEVDGPWHDALVAWTEARIRKVSRRARGAQWTAAEEVDGVTATVGDAQARAYVPGRVGDLDPRLKKLQIGGTDLPADEPGDPDPRFPVLWIDASLTMTLGKAAAQVGHSVMILAGSMSVADAESWCETGYVCSVREASREQWARLRAEESAGRAVAVRDAGFTEVAPGSTTVIAVSPRAFP
jgi:peptidyl-tRNA hydrolase